MSFSNLSPAERLKVSVLGGVIVIVLFFVVHTFLGALSPSKPAASASTDSTAAPAAASAGSGASAASAPPAPPAPVGGADGFTGIKLAQASKSKLGDSPDLDMGTHDPFVPIRDEKASGKSAPAPLATTAAAGGGKSAPDVTVKAARSSGGPESGGGMSPLPAFGQPGGGSTGMMSPAAVLPPPEPTIRIVGIVHGEPSVATIQVADRTLLARPGDALHNGYRLMEVGPEAVVIRCKGDRMTLRVGAIINERKDDAKVSSQP